MEVGGISPNLEKCSHIGGCLSFHGVQAVATKERESRPVAPTFRKSRKVGQPQLFTVLAIYGAGNDRRWASPPFSF
jgi:hypothetical protein